MVTWTAPEALWLLAAVPLVWLAHLVARTNFNRRQRWLQAGVRSMILIALSTALARPMLATNSSRESVVYAVDVSHSISSAAIEAAAKKIDDLNAVLRPSHFRVIAFGATAAALDGTAALRRVAQMKPGAPSPAGLDRQGTDIQVALDAARAELATGYVPRIVLFSDGRATAGDADAALARIIEARIPVSVEPLAQRSLGDTWVDSLELPDRIPAGATFAARVDVGSQRDGQAIVELRSAGKIIGTQSIALSRGITPVGINAVLDTPGGHVLQAAVRISNDPLAANDVMERGVWADPRTKLLYVEGTPASARYLSNALSASGFEVTVRPSTGLPATGAQLDPFDVVVLSDVPRASIGAPSMSALADWVEQGGGGLRVRVLLLDPEAPALARRAAEIGESPESLASGVRLAEARLRELADTCAVEVYRYAMLPTWRLIRADATLFVSAFDAGWEGHESATYKVMETSHGPLFRGFRRMFEAITDGAQRTV